MRRQNIQFKEWYYKRKYPGIHSSVTIGYETLIYGQKNEIKIGKGTYIQRGCSLTGKINIGKNCAIASNVNIRAHTHGAGKGAQHLLKMKEINIGDFVWIGANVFVKEGIKIGDNVIIGANSVVTKDIPSNQVVAGVPAKKIRVSLKAK